MANKKNTTTTATANVKTGKELQAKQAEMSKFEQELAQANEKLRMALAWKVRLSTHYVVTAEEKTLKYISVDSGMPRDVKVILVEGKDHNISVRSKATDAKYEESPKSKKSLSDDELSYNERVDSWAKTCGREAVARINLVLANCKGFDELWALTKLLERNAEIAKANAVIDLLK